MKRVRVGDISVQIRGVSYNKSEVRTAPAEGYSALLRGGNIGAHGLMLEDLQYVPTEKVSEKQKLRKGDVVLVASSGSLDVVGKAAAIDDSFAGTFGAFCKVLRPSSQVDQRYFAHYFKTSRYRRAVSSLAAGANINNLKNEHLNELAFPLPTLSEQRRIADVLDKADALRTKRREAIAHLGSVSQSIFHEMFDDEPTVRLGDLGVVQGGLQVTRKRQVLPLEVPYLRVANVFRGRIDLSEVKTMRVTAVELERTQLRRGDLLFVEGHGNAEEVGRCAMWPGGSEPTTHQNHLIRFRPDASQVVPEYATQAANSARGKDALARRAKTTSGLNTITASNVRDHEIPVPPLKLQQEFASRVAAVQRLTATHRAHLAELDNLFRSLQDRAFKGEL